MAATSGTKAVSATAIGGRVAWGVADQAVFSLTSFALAVAVAKHATAAEFGAFGIAYAIYILALGGVEAFTTEVVTVRGAHLSTTDRRRMLAEASGTAICCGLCCAGAGVLLAILARGSAATIVPAMLIPAPLLFAQDVWRFGFFTSGRAGAALLNDLLWAGLLAAGFVVLEVSGHTEPAWFVWAWSGAGAVCGAVGAVQARCLPRMMAVLSWMRTQGRAGGRYAGEFLALYGAAQAVLLSVGLLGGLAESAGYRGAQLLFGPLQVLLNAVRLAVMPLISRTRQSGPAYPLRRAGLIVSAFGAAIVLAWGVVMLSLPDRLGREVLGSSWSATQPVVPPLLLVTVAAAVGLGALVVLRASDALRGTFKIRVTGAVAIFLLGTTGAWLGGSVVAAAGVAVGATLMSAALWRQAWPLTSRAAPSGVHQT